MFIAKVQETIKRHALFDEAATVMVALSGGADSVALLRVIAEAGYTCKALHCNFHLRGEESNRDEAFAKDLCEKLGIECITARFDTLAYAKEKGISVEMAAREQRYTWFKECIDAKAGNVVAVAHNADDNVETFMINLTRGSGLKGLRGIPIKNGPIVRPLLNISRREITEYLQCLGQEFMTDSTNLSDDFTRNKFRLSIIPLLEQINPSFKNTIAETAERLREASALAEEAIKTKAANIQSGGKIDIAKLKNELAQTTILFEILHPLGFNTRQINDIKRAMDAQPGKAFASKTHKVTKDRGEFIISKLESSGPKAAALDYGTTHFGEGKFIVSKCDPAEAMSLAKKDKSSAYVDANSISGTLIARKWQEGDTFIPFGMRGRKNISDFLTDLKKSIDEKGRTYVVTDGNNIIWVAGERIDDRYKVTPHTAEAIRIEYAKG